MKSETQVYYQQCFGYLATVLIASNFNLSRISSSINRTIIVLYDWDRILMLRDHRKAWENDAGVNCRRRCIYANHSRCPWPSLFRFTVFLDDFYWISFLLLRRILMKLFFVYLLCCDPKKWCVRKFFCPGPSSAKVKGWKESGSRRTIEKLP